MLLEVYARWIPGADCAEENRRPTEEVPGANEKARKPSADAGLRALNIGRRDWTRTNDPHHVKVVL